MTSESQLSDAVIDVEGSLSGGSRFCQVGLRTLLLFAAACGVWGAHWANRWEIDRARSSVLGLQSMVRELRIDDPTKIAAIMLPNAWHNEFEWDVWLPETPEGDAADASHRLALATRNDVGSGLPSKFEEALLEPGRHRINVAIQRQKSDDRWTMPRDEVRIVVSVDGDVVLEAVEALDWIVLPFIQGNYHSSTQFPADFKVIFLRERFLRGRPTRANPMPTGDKGIWLWLEKAPAGERE